MTTPQSKEINAAEAKLAATIRQYERALAAQDGDALALEAGSLCTFLELLLSLHLESHNSWDANERWIDGLIDAQIARETHGQLKISGRMIWGLSTDPGGHQWSEPFVAQVVISKNGLQSYELRFADTTDEDSKRVASGFYPTLLANDVDSASTQFDNLEWLCVVSGGEGAAQSPNAVKH